MINERTDIRKYLRAALAERCLRNPAYSLRAFARHVGLSPSHLSRVLNGRKSLSREAALKIALELDLSEEQITQFVRLLDNPKNKLNEDQKDRQLLNLETFHILADWYHLPLYELIRAKGFRSDIRWISQKLKISPNAVKASLDKLEAVGLIKKIGNKITIIPEAEIETTDDLSSEAIKKHHNKMSEKAIEAIKEQTVDEREFQGLHFAFSQKHIKKAKMKIREFVKQFEAEFQPASGTDIYQLNVQFFRLTKKDGGRT